MEGRKKTAVFSAGGSDFMRTEGKTAILLEKDASNPIEKGKAEGNSVIN